MEMFLNKVGNTIELLKEKIQNFPFQMETMTEGVQSEIHARLPQFALNPPPLPPKRSLIIPRSHCYLSGSDKPA